MLFCMMMPAASAKVTGLNQIKLAAGGYSISSDTGSVSGVGALSAEYLMSVGRKFTLAPAFHYSSQFSGADFGVQYCLLGDCTVERLESDPWLNGWNVGTWGVYAGVGVGVRFFIVSTATVSSVGFYPKIGVSRFLTASWRVVLEAQQMVLRNGDQRLTLGQGMIGVSYTFLPQ
jgi:hypothetical protein